MIRRISSGFTLPDSSQPLGVRGARRALLVLASAVAFVVVGATAAVAAPHFQSATSSVDSAGVLTVSFDERGLGNGNIEYLLTADVSAEFGCFNGGGKHPQAANKETVSDTVNIPASFESKNGRVVESMSSDQPTAGDFSCPNGQRLRLISADYTNILLTDTTNGVSTPVPDASSS